LRPPQDVLYLLLLFFRDKDEVEDVPVLAVKEAKERAKGTNLVYGQGLRNRLLIAYPSLYIFDVPPDV
jgi:hypothetical protein